MGRQCIIKRHPMVMPDSSTSIVRVLSKGPWNPTKVKGAGVYVGAGRVVTCAHVVQEAANRKGNDRPADGTTVLIDFPFAENSMPRLAIVAAWDFEGKGSAHDVAGLSLVDVAPADVETAVLVDVRELRGHGYHVLGFPEKHPSGIETQGTLRGRNPLGWVQASATGDFPIVPGFSGAPVWDESAGTFVGIMGAEGEDGRVGFMIPTSIIARTWPEAVGASHVMSRPTILPAVSAYYQLRHEDHRLREMLLASVAARQRSWRAQIVGMPGLGKTALAVALARDAAVQQAFARHIFWVPVGRDADIVQCQQRLLSDARDAGLVARAADDAAAAASGPSSGLRRLSQLFADAQALVILDDVWTQAQLSGLAVTEMSAVLITTRHANVCPACETLRLAPLEPRAGVELLARWAETDVAALPEAALRIARESKYLPLALVIAGAMVRGRPERWSMVLDRLVSAELSHLPVPLEGYPYPDLAAAIAASEEFLDADIRSRFDDLAVFPEDTAIPASVLATWWNLPPAAVADALYELQDHALVQLGAGAEVRLHDLVHDFLRARIPNAPLLQTRFLGSFHYTPGELPATREPYFLEHLAYHLIQAGRSDALHELLGRSDPSGAHAWYVLRNKLGQLTGFTADVIEAQRLAADGGDPHALQARYALVRSSIGSLSGTLPRSFVRRLVDGGIWQLPRALMFARAIVHPAERASMLVELLRVESDEQREQRVDEALKAVDAIADSGIGGISAEERRATLIVEAASTVHAGDASIEWLLQRAASLSRRYLAAEIWLALVPRLSHDQLLQALDSALDAARTLRMSVPPTFPMDAFFDWRRDHLRVVHACTAILMHVKDAGASRLKSYRESIDKAFAHHGVAMYAEVGDYVLSPAWPAVAEYFPALEIDTMSDEDIFESRGALRQLLPALTPADRARVVRIAMSDSRETYGELRAWAARMPMAERRVAVDAAKGIPSRFSRAIALADMVPLLEGESARATARLAWTALQEKLADPNLDDGSRGELVMRTSVAAGSLAADARSDLLGLIRSLVDPEHRASALVRFAVDADPPLRRMLFVEALEAAAAIPETHKVRDFVRTHGDRFPLDLANEVLRRVSAIGDEDALLAAARVLWPRLDNERRRTFVSWELASAATMKRSDEAQILEWDAAKLIEHQPRLAMDRAAALSRDEDRALALASLASPAAVPIRRRALRMASRAIRALVDPRAKVAALRKFLPNVRTRAGDRRVRALIDLALRMEYPYHRAETMASLLPLLDPPEQAAALARVRQTIDADRRGARALALLVPFFSLEDTNEIVDDYFLGEDESKELLPAALRRLAALGHVEAAWERLAREGAETAWVPTALEGVLKALPSRLVPRAQRLVEYLAPGTERSKLLGLLAARQAELGDVKAARGTLNTIEDLKERVLGTARVSRHASGDERERLLEQGGAELVRLGTYDGPYAAIALAEATSAGISPDCSRRLLRTAVLAASEWERRAAARTVSAWMPIAAALNGDAVFGAYFDAIVDVRRWWP
jgi:hypothetical protein